jgi:hypothetical protein
MIIIKRVTEGKHGLTYEVVVDGVPTWAQWVPWAAGQRSREDAAETQEHEALKAKSRRGVTC